MPEGANETETDHGTAINYEQWPPAEGHEQQLRQALECVNDAILRSQPLYDHSDALSGDAAEAAAEEARGVRQRIEATGAIVEQLLDLAPDIMDVDYDEQQACNAYYSRLHSADDALRGAWESVNDVVAAADAATNGTAWSGATDTGRVEDAVTEARTELWKAQAEVEQLLIDRFDHAEESFAHPVEELSQA